MSSEATYAVIRLENARIKTNNHEPGRWCFSVDEPGSKYVDLVGTDAELVALADLIYTTICPTRIAAQGDEVVEATDAELLANGISVNG